MTDKKQWSLKHRPASPSGMVVGNPEILDRADDLASASQVLLIVGETGTGKTTYARILARLLNGDDWEKDLLELNFAVDRGIDDVRQLIQRLQYAPKVNKTVVIIDEVHAATPTSAAAMLKLLEDPPHPDVLFVLCTDQPWKLPRPMLNRCRLVEIEPPSVSDMARHLFRIARKERIKATPADLKSLALRVAKGSNIPRMAIQNFQDACSLLAKGRAVKDVFSIVASSQDNDLNKVVGSVIIAIYSSGDLDKAASFILTKASSIDGMGLLIRLQTANYYGLVVREGGKFNWLGKAFTEALKAKKLNPNIKDVLFVSSRLNAIREQLREIITDPTMLIATELANLPYLLAEGDEPNEGD